MRFVVYHVSEVFAEASLYIISGLEMAETMPRYHWKCLCCCGLGCGQQWEPAPLASASHSPCPPLLVTRSLSCPFVCGLWPSLGRRLKSKYKKKRQSTFHLKSPRKRMWLLYRNGSNKGRKEYCFYSFWDIKHLENVIDWQGLIYHLSHSLCALSLSLPTHHTQADTHSPTMFFFFLFAFLFSSSLSEIEFILILLSRRTPVAIYN